MDSIWKKNEAILGRLELNVIFLLHWKESNPFLKGKSSFNFDVGIRERNRLESV